MLLRERLNERLCKVRWGTIKVLRSTIEVHSVYHKLFKYKGNLFGQLWMVVQCAFLTSGILSLMPSTLDPWLDRSLSFCQGISLLRVTMYGCVPDTEEASRIIIRKGN